MIFFKKLILFNFLYKYECNKTKILISKYIMFKMINKENNMNKINKLKN